MVAGGRELIDTLWNVNKNWNDYYSAYFYELIDTLWNVNLWTGNTYYVKTGINRYIMECK